MWLCSVAFNVGEHVSCAEFWGSVSGNECGCINGIEWESVGLCKWYGMRRRVWLHAELRKTLPSPSGHNADPQGESGIHILYLKVE